MQWQNPPGVHGGRLRTGTCGGGAEGGVHGPGPQRLCLLSLHGQASRPNAGCPAHAGMQLSVLATGRWRSAVQVVGMACERGHQSRGCVLGRAELHIAGPGLTLRRICGAQSPCIDCR